ncbi:MAG: hypothetical protein ACIWVG_04215 [Gloeotrichia echinulata HAB0833]
MRGNLVLLSAIINKANQEVFKKLLTDRTLLAFVVYVSPYILQ